MNRRQFKKRSCLCKTRYKSHGEAHTKLMALTKYVPGCRIYKCKFCRGWHIGHKDRLTSVNRLPMKGAPCQV